MPVTSFSRFTSILAVAALAAAVVGFARWRALSRSLGFRPALGLAALVAAGSTAGSLVYSEYFLFEPCRLCWYQRIAMYPLAVILGLAWLRRDRTVIRHATPLALAGAATSALHLFTQWVSIGSVACRAGPSCSIRYVTEFGFVTIPFMALAGFLAILAALRVARNA